MCLNYQQASTKHSASTKALVYVHVPHYSLTLHQVQPLGPLWWGHHIWEDTEYKAWHYILRVTLMKFKHRSMYVEPNHNSQNLWTKNILLLFSVNIKNHLHLLFNSIIIPIFTTLQQQMCCSLGEKPFVVSDKIRQRERTSLIRAYISHDWVEISIQVGAELRGRQMWDKDNYLCYGWPPV